MTKFAFINKIWLQDESEKIHLKSSFKETVSLGYKKESNCESNHCQTSFLTLENVLKVSPGPSHN